MKTLLLALTSTFFLGGVALADKGSDQSEAVNALRDGLTLIRDNKFDKWLDEHCSTEKLCFNNNSRRSLKRFNLPAIHKRSKSCVKPDGSIKVTRTDKISDTEVKLFVQCEETASPYPFRLGLDNGKWKFYSL